MLALTILTIILARRMKTEISAPSKGASTEEATKAFATPTRAAVIPAATADPRETPLPKTWPTPTPSLEKTGEHEIRADDKGENRTGPGDDDGN